MCQLLGISSTAPTPVFSSSLLSPFVQRGGNTDIHSHGWGVAYYNYCNKKKKLRLKTFRDASPAATSSKVQDMLKNQSHERMLDTKTLLAHIRYATVGEVSINNVHPFHRELFGVEFVFAHNGDVPMFKGGRKGVNKFVHSLSGEEEKSKNDTFESDGDTDSEHIFCYILNALHERFDSFPLIDELYYAIHELCLEIVQHQEGVILNFLLGVGSSNIFAFSWPGKRPGSTTWNGLYYMLKAKQQEQHGINSMPYDANKDQVAAIATKPLGLDKSLWIEFRKGELLLFCNGIVTNHGNANRRLWVGDI